MEKLKLNSLEKNILSARNMNFLKGGDNDGSKGCACSCYYRNVGGSSIEANAMANYRIPANSTVTTKDQVVAIADENGNVVDFWSGKVLGKQ